MIVWCECLEIGRQVPGSCSPVNQLATKHVHYYRASCGDGWFGFNQLSLHCMSCVESTSRPGTHHRVTVELVRSWSSAPGQMLQPGQLMQPPGQLLQPVPGMITAPGAHLLPLQGSHPAIASQPPAWDATNNQGAPVPCCGLTAAGGGCCSPIGQPTKEQQQQQQQVLHQQCVHFGRAAAHARCCCCAARRAAAGACDTAAAALPNAALMHFKQQQQQEVEEGSNRLMVGLGAQQGHPMPGSSGGCSPGCQSCCRSDAPLPSSARVVRAPAPASAAAASRQAAAGQLLGSCHPRSSSQLD